MCADKKSLILPVLLIAIGIGWLLTAMGVVPNVDWIWTLLLGAVGLLALLINGIDKVSIVVGPLFILASFFSLLRQMGHLYVNIEVPLLVIAAGTLLLIARHRSIPAPKWINEGPNTPT